MDKPKLSFEKLIDKFKEKGITTGTFTEGLIIDYLQNRSYYYKISSYRKNFPKTPNRNYDKLTFDHLVVTAKIDVRLREYLLNLCLDVEHATRTKLMTLLTNDPDEDGYKIVEEFQDEFPDKFNEILQKFRSNKYRRDMFEKRTHISVWVLLEIIDYGSLVQLLEFYNNKVDKEKGLIYSRQHKFIKNIRNSCAHSNVFLINLFDRKITDNYIPRPNAATKSYASSMKINLALVSFLKIIDIINLFYVHSQICSKELNQRRHTEGRAIFDKYLSNKILLAHSKPLEKFFESIFIKSVDFLIK